MILPLILSASIAMTADDLLPDITIWEEKLLDRAIDTTRFPGRRLLRLSTGTPNIGMGRLEIRGGEVLGDRQVVYQRIYRTDGSWWERPAGHFTYHAGHNHIHFDDWAEYRLREIVGTNGVGPVVARGSKTSFCILDLTVYDSSHPAFNSTGFYRSCGSIVQGLTPGWADVYSKSLEDQWIDITDVPDGEYWLEAEVDPEGNILEADKTNNIGRVRVTIEAPPELVPDRYEPNDTRAQVDGRPEGGKNSPNLGLVNRYTDIDHLSILPNDNDWFKFRMNNVGRPGDFIRISSPFPDGDLDLELYNASGVRIASSASITNTEQISLNNRPAGTYYIRVFPYRGTNPRYKLEIQPAGNNPPILQVLEPNEPLWVEMDFEAFPIRWQTSDPDGDPVTVGVWLYADKGSFDKGMAIPVPGYEALPGTDQVANINTASLPFGRWWVYLKATDGGATTIGHAPAWVQFYIKGDLNLDGHFDHEDWMIIDKFWRNYQIAPMRLPPGWREILDADYDGQITANDIKILRNRLHGH